MRQDNSTQESVNIIGYNDADFAADRIDRESITGGWITVDGMPVAWLAKKQSGMSLSTMKAEYTAASVVVMQMIGLRDLLVEFGGKCNELWYTM